MKMMGCDLHAAQQAIAMLDCKTGEILEKTLKHKGRQYGSSPRRSQRRSWWASKPPARWGWFLRLMEELGITGRVGDPAAIRKAETRRQKHDRRDAHLLL